MKKWFLLVMLLAMVIAMTLLLRMPQTTDPVGQTEADPAAAANRSFDAALRPAAFAEPEGKKKETEPMAVKESPSTSTSSGANVRVGTGGGDITVATAVPEPQPPGVEGREQGIAVDILAMPDGDAKNLAFTELMDRWGEEDIETAWEFFDQVKDDIYLKRAFYKGIMPHVAKHDPELVLETIESGAWWQDQWRPAKQAVLKVAETDIERATAYFSNTTKGKQQGDVAYQLASKVAASGGRDAAFAFADTLENPNARGHAIRATVSGWMREDSLAASSYVNDLGDAYLKDHAILGLVDGIWLSNPQDSLTWAASISDSTMRSNTYVKLTRAWQQRGESQNIARLLDSGGLTTGELEAVNAVLAPVE